MRIKKKPIESVRIRKDRAESLKNKAFEISMEAGEIVTEADLINFLIDTQLEKIILENKELSIDEL